jgi:multidrug resistance protein, MATE family
MPVSTAAAAPATDTSALPFPGSGSLRRRVFGLAWPTIAENLLQTMVGIVDTLLVARLGAEAIAGVGASLQVMFLVIGVLSSVSVGSSILVAQAIGAVDRRRANALAKQAVVWGAVLAVPLSVAGWLAAEPTGHWLGLAPDVAAITAGYLRVTLGGSLFLVLMYVCGAVLRGSGDARSPMMAMLVANLLNASLAFLLIFGHLGLPALGPQGSAWAALTGRAVATTLLLVALASGWRTVCIRSRGGWRPNLGVARRILALGVPAGAEQAVTSLGFVVFTMLMASQGTAMLAAQRITFNALSLAFLPGIGFGLATTALVGMSVGARRVELGGAAAAVAARWALLWMGAVSATYFVSAPLILSLFQPEPAVAEAGQQMLRIIALAQPGWALVFVYSGALRGLGNTLFPLAVNTGGIWLVVAITAVLLRFMGTDAVTPWWGFVVMAPVMASLAWRRFTQSVAGWPRAPGTLDVVPRPVSPLPASPPPEAV